MLKFLCHQMVPKHLKLVVRQIWKEYVKKTENIRHIPGNMNFENKL